MSKMRPYDDRVVIKPIEADQTSKGGVILPDTAQEDTMHGVVIAVGPGRFGFDNKRIPMITQVNDIVVFPKFGPTKFEYEDIDYVIAKEGELSINLTDREEKSNMELLVEQTLNNKNK